MLNLETPPGPHPQRGSHLRQRWRTRFLRGRWCTLHPIPSPQKYFNLKSHMFWKRKIIWTKLRSFLGSTCEFSGVEKKSMVHWKTNPPHVPSIIFWGTESWLFVGRLFPRKRTKAPENRLSQKERIVSQPFFFRGLVSMKYHSSAEKKTCFFQAEPLGEKKSQSHCWWTRWWTTCYMRSHFKKYIGIFSISTGVGFLRLIVWGCMGELYRSNLQFPC